MTESLWQVREAVQEDLPAIVAIYNQTVASRMVTADLEPVSVAQRQAWFDAHSPQRHPIWVAERAGCIVGWLSFSAFHSRAAYDASAELSIYVDAAERGQGLGCFLMQRAIGYAPGIGLRNLIGPIFGHNGPSLALFERFGFVRWGDLPDVAVLDGIERSLIIVGKKLGTSVQKDL
ncbi:MAG: N-acetyltransferase [Candidatus Dactylopiibacterium carminicum]|uniref:N-acetyltransferase n=1 Tax=Candidatus Dactylopiibacterium carminicum TaxID=857335 RepID=A0A272EXD9_9RHOO|nr:GNAT family N-acetyltransferase [Candidatus Dactylopiibacterium carminicum]KAF7600213.1 N-acetyltransferase [Candidatus Dactylopiibacterium carminicum]PAS94769.1 MAG: N-acetyltransferase [Candidatus Dactylopiibacterium carminicum]PAS97694.1 MAG: N-acetyltransferase [Candidatus Dactylopiibacterium carminicum]PAT00209.1 MAG: N-acetyltransferase [Candidatus Dactylopiibacterium carminicum]